MENLLKDLEKSECLTGDSTLENESKEISDLIAGYISKKMLAFCGGLQQSHTFYLFNLVIFERISSSIADYIINFTF